MTSIFKVVSGWKGQDLGRVGLMEEGLPGVCKYSKVVYFCQPKYNVLSGNQ